MGTHNADTMHHCSTDAILTSNIINRDPLITLSAICWLFKKQTQSKALMTQFEFIFNLFSLVLFPIFYLIYYFLPFRVLINSQDGTSQIDGFWG